jgi:hypothetical protein
MPVSWNDASFKKNAHKAGMDGIEEWCRVEWQTKAKQDCPVHTGTMRGSLGVERDDANSCCYVGGGGAARDYILKQEIDRSLHHDIGKAGFIGDTVQDKASKLSGYVKKHL